MKGLELFDDFSKYPRLFLLAELIRDLLLILMILLALKGFLWAVRLIILIPAPDQPAETEPLFDFHLTNVVLTMSDGVSLVLATMIAALTLLKAGKELWKQVFG